MSKTTWASTGLTFALAAVLCGQAFAAEGRMLWKIGEADHNTAEFALGPKDFEKFAQDPVFVVGASVAKRDWPYVHPGPSDAWAGTRKHSSAIYFGLKQKPKNTCRFHMVLADTHSQTPPALRLEINGKKLSDLQTPPGGGDASIQGEPSKGRECRFDVKIPSDILKIGTNEIVITTLSGSWVLYDWIGFEAPEDVELTPVADSSRVTETELLPALVERGGKLLSLVRIRICHIGQPAEATIQIADAEPVATTLKIGSQDIEATVPRVEKETAVDVVVKSGGKTIADRQMTLKPVRQWVVYILAHSHVDIGYTQLQTEVEEKQRHNIDVALDLIQKTAGYPAEARFKWNSEVLWAVDSYLRKESPEKQQQLLEAIRAGQIDLHALYGNELTGLCRPEELLQLCDCAQRLSKRCGVKIDTALISDVPGYTWGIVPALAQAGVKHFSIGPNYIDRIGRTMSTWQDKPFYWIAPDGRQKVLCWIPFMGYALGHTGYRLDPQVLERVAQLEKENYPYDFVQLRWTVGGDNGPPDASLPDVVKNWNAKYASPKMVIATASQMFRDFEKRYGDKVPEVRGDFTPYWEDGAASSARETALNRTAAERLVQAATLWAMLRPGPFPTEDFQVAWRNLILYDEHTWGAHNSIHEPDLPFVKDQWKIKQAFALDGDAQSKNLLDSVLIKQGPEPKPSTAVDVFNTCSWPRTDLVILSGNQSGGAEGPYGEVVTDSDGKAVPSQVLKSGELAFLAKDVPPLAGKRFTIAQGKAPSKGLAKAGGPILGSSAITLKVDPASGTIISLRGTAINAELCDAKSGIGLNRYDYVLADRVKEARQSGPAKVTVRDAGPLVASLVVESEAPGCAKFSREFRVVDGLDRLDIINVIDKKAVREKEGVHLGFAFNVPQGVMRMDIPWAVIQPEKDQLLGACKNWFTVGRWVDVSNQEYGVTWATLDAPLVEVGAITADKIGSQVNPNAWLGKIEPSQTLYSWVMNNHWHTNYRAEQDGPTTFRYSLLPHKQYDPVAAQRFGIERSQPLVVRNAWGSAPSGRPLLELDTPDVMVTSIKPSEDGKAWIVRLFAAAGRPAKVGLRWGDLAPKGVFLSNLAEERGEPVTFPMDIPAWGIVTLRAEL